MSVHFTVCNNIKHNLPKNLKYTIENNICFIFMGYQNATKNVCFMVWKFGSMALEKFWNYAKMSLYKPCILKISKYS